MTDYQGIERQARYVIIDSVTADVLSVPMTLGQCNYIASRERDVAAQNGSPCPLAVVAAGSQLRDTQEFARRRMAGNPPRNRIIYDGPWWLGALGAGL